METDKVIMPKEFCEELVILIFVAFKGLGLAIAGILFAMAFSLHFVFQWLFIGFQTLYNLIRDWNVVVPNVLKFTE